MIQKNCECCKKIIIEDLEKWLKENKETNYIQCPFCYWMEKIK